MRAVRGVFENSGGDAFVRHGTDALSVHIDFGDAKVTWSKGPKVKPTYTIKGKTLHPGRMVPDEVLDIGITPVQAGSAEVWPQIAPQFTGQLFLLDMPGSAIAEVVSDVDRVSQLTEALRYADADKRSANSDLKLRRQDRDSATAYLSKFDGLTTVEDTITQIESLSTKSDALETAVRYATEMQRRLYNSHRLVHLYGAITKVNIPDTTMVCKMSNDIMDVNRIHTSMSRQRRVVQALTLQIHVPNVLDIQQLSSNITLIQSIKTQIATSKRKIDTFPPNVHIPNYDHAQQHMLLIRDIRQMSAKLNVARANVNVYGQVQINMPDTQPAVELHDHIRTVQATAHKLGNARSHVASLSEELVIAERMRENLQAEVDALITELGVCPTCGTASTATHTHK